MFAVLGFAAAPVTPAPPAPWRPMNSRDIGPVEALGNRIHSTLPEDASIFAERLALFAAGAFAADHKGALAAYAIAHPWIAGAPPALNQRLGAIPAAARVLYLHDIVVDPIRRSLGLAGTMIGHLPALAAACGLPAIELVAVLGTANFWRGHGFAVIDDPTLAPVLAKYGDGACLMRRKV